MPYSGSYVKNNKSGFRQQRWGNNRPPRSRGQHRKLGQYIHPSRFIQAASATNVQPYESKSSFAELNIDTKLKNNLAVKGYKSPSPIQDQTIPAGLAGRDIIGIAETGTGKTAAFTIPIIQRLVSDANSAALIVAPTRELAQQIEVEFRELSRDCKIYNSLLIGGASMGRQLHELRQKPRVIIGTPGRIKDHLSRRTLNLNNFNMVVLDEVDRMLDMGFVHDVSEILQQTNDDRQVLFFSATMENRVRKLIDNFTTNPFTASVKASAASENVHQDIVKYQSDSEKIDKLHDILIKEKVTKVIVFDETKRSVERLSNELSSRGFLVDALHGGKSQGQRQRALNKFKSSEINVLVATDVAARGIDVVDITHVINFTAPRFYEDYIHRIGRTGRAGQIGHALTFVVG